MDHHSHRQHRFPNSGSSGAGNDSTATTVVNNNNGDDHEHDNNNNADDDSNSSIKAQKRALGDANNSIQKTLGLLHQLYLTVSSFSVASQLPLLHRLNSLVTELDTMQKLADNCDIQIPLEVLNLIDDGKNPDEFTKDVFNNCISKNQITKGKADAFKSLRKHLLEDLEQTFPDEVEDFRKIRAASAAELKQLAQAQSMLPNGDVKVKPEH